MNRLVLLFILIVFVLSAGCATFRSDIDGKYEGEGEQNFGAEKVDVFFIFSHYKQSKGFDAIPKLENRRQIIRDFDDLFIDSCNEFTNLGHYSTFTNFASDVSQPSRRAEKDSLIVSHDYIIRIKFMKENSYPKYFLGILTSFVTATILPIPYSRHYTVDVNVYDHKDLLINSYQRSASLTKWVEAALIFIYPFHTEKRKEEEVYINLMHDVFRQIESEKVLI